MERALNKVAEELMLQSLITVAMNNTDRRKPGAFEDRPWRERLLEANGQIAEARRVLEGR